MPKTPISSLESLLTTITNTLSRLANFKTFAGDANPRAFDDTSAHLSTISSHATTLTKQAQAPANEASIQRAVEVCLTQLRILNQILDKYLPAAAGAKMPAKISAQKVRELYKEKEIPKVQKTLMGYEGVFGGLVAARG